jgi:hypothetical protein
MAESKAASVGGLFHSYQIVTTYSVSSALRTFEPSFIVSGVFAGRIDVYDGLSWNHSFNKRSDNQVRRPGH